MSPEFCLRWSNHQSNLVNVFKDLLQTGELVDVTLSAGGEFIHAHRVMLSACSLYFKELFAVNPNHHPIVILKDFHIEDLKTVVDFIYQGEVNVAQERLPHVLKAAETLRIKGLAENPRPYEEFQTNVSQDIPRLGSQSTGSSFSDSRDQGIEVSDDAGAERTTPPHKRRRTNFDTEESKRVIVKEEEPSNSNTNEENRQSEEENNQSCLVRESSTLLQSLSPSTGEERASPSHSPTPPPSLPPTPSLTNNGDAEGGALPGLITHGQGSVKEWSSEEKHVCLSAASSPQSPDTTPTKHSSPHSSNEITSSTSSQKKSGSAPKVVTIKGDQNTTAVIAETVRKLRNSSTSLTIVNISTNLKEEKKPTKKTLNCESPRSSNCKPEVMDNKDFNFNTCTNKNSLMHPDNIDSKEILANFLSSCTGANGGPDADHSTAGFDLSQTAAMMMMLNNNNTTVTPAHPFNKRHYPGVSPQYNSNQYYPNCQQPGVNESCTNDNFNGTNNGTGANASGAQMPLSLPSLLAPLGPHGPSFFLSPHSWHQQFRCMSPNMLMAIEAVRSGKMGFTQAGRTFGVNGRTLWVYYRRLGYKVHNTFRGRRSKDTASTTSNMSPQFNSAVNSNRMPHQFNNSNPFFNNAPGNQFQNNSANFFNRNGADDKLSMDSPTHAGFQNFHSKFFPSQDNISNCGNSSASGNNGGAMATVSTNGEAAEATPSTMNSCLIGTNPYNGEETTATDAQPVPSPSSLIGPIFGTSYPPPENSSTSYSASASIPPATPSTDDTPQVIQQCSGQGAANMNHFGHSFNPMFFGNNFGGFGGNGDSAMIDSGNGSMVKQESQRQLSEAPREPEDNNTSLEALLEACTTRSMWHPTL